LLGAEILVAPIKNKCFTSSCSYDKEVYLPKGRWIHLWTGTAFGKDSAGTRTTVAAPLGSPAVFYREGSAVGAKLVADLKTAGAF
jgi:alpha-glucosidase